MFSVKNVHQEVNISIKNGKTKLGYNYVYHAIANVSQLISESKDKY